MQILLTGAFGNIGISALEELTQRGHQVRCFDIKTTANQRLAKKLLAPKKMQKQVEVVWGDLRNPQDLAMAVQGQEVVIHLAFVIPTNLSATGLSSEADPEWARAINVGGTRNLLDALSTLPNPPKLLFTSSLHIYGRTQDQLPPRTIDDFPQPIEEYAKHKVECEQMVRESGLIWVIFRLAAALPIRLLLDADMFDVPLDNRIEFVHTRDVGLAIANALENEQVWDGSWLIGGGPACQLYQRDIVGGVFNAVGVGMLPVEAFTTIPYPTDWLDTAESQKLLQFQHRTLDDYIAEVKKLLGFRRYLIMAFRPFIRRWLVNKSPSWQRVADISGRQHDGSLLTLDHR